MKFGSTWLKATLLGSAMLAMGFVSAQEKITLTIEANGAEYKTEPEKLTELEKKSKVVLTVTKTPEGKEVDKVTCDDAEAKVEPKDGKYEITLGDKNAKVTIELKDKAPEGTIPLTAEFNEEGGKVYLVNMKLNKEGKPDEYIFDPVIPFPFNAVKGTWYGVVVEWKEGYVVEKFDRVLTRGEDVKTDNLLAENLKNVDKFKKGEKIAAYGTTIAFSDKTTVTAAKYVVSFKKGTAPKPGAVEDNAFAAVSVYPNPFADKLIVNEVAEASRVTLVNAQGVVLRSVAVNGANQIALDVTDVPAGIYMVVVENGAARRAFKVVK